MIIIGLEGLDKSGKKTQSDLLHQALFERGLEVRKSEFHRYDTPTGELIRRFLEGNYKVNQLAIESIMAADKYAQLDRFNELKSEADILILDRYLTSQMIYGHSNGTPIEFTSNLLQFMPAPDFQFYLDIPPEESMKRKGEHGENDKYESDKELLTRVRENYLTYFRGEEKAGKGLIIDATQSVTDIHQAILSRTIELGWGALNE